MKEKIQKFVHHVNEKIQTKLTAEDKKFVNSEYPLKFVDMGDSYQIRLYDSSELVGIDSYSISKAIDRLFSGGRGTKYWLEVDYGVDKSVSAFSPQRNFHSFIFGLY